MKKDNIREELMPLLRKKISDLAAIEKIIKEQKKQIESVITDLEDESKDDELLKYDLGKKIISKIIESSIRTFNLGATELKALQKKFEETLTKNK